MAIRIIRKEGDPILKKKSKTVSEITQSIRQLIEDMKETMVKYDGVGIAAVQVGILKRVIVFENQETKDQEALINPEILESSGSQLCNEGCLSFPGITGNVERPEKVVVRFLDEEGQEQKREFSAINAVIVSHEVDHMEGIVFVDKARDIEKDEDSE